MRGAWGAGGSCARSGCASLYVGAGGVPVAELSFREERGAEPDAAFQCILQLPSVAALPGPFIYVTYLYRAGVC